MQCKNRMRSTRSQSRKTRRDISRKNNNSNIMNSSRSNQWTTDSTNNRPKSDSIMSSKWNVNEWTVNGNNRTGNGNNNTKNNNSKNSSSTSSNKNSSQSQSNTISLLRKNSSSLHLEISLSTSYTQNTMSMRQPSRGSSKSWKGWRKKPRERRSWSNKQSQNKRRWHRIVNWELMHYPPFKAEKANFRWFQISYNRRRGKWDKIWWIYKKWISCKKLCKDKIHIIKMKDYQWKNYSSKNVNKQNKK